jgi:predicted nucleotidyltransferase
MMKEKKSQILQIWKFYGKLHHNCPRKKAEMFLNTPISQKEYPAPVTALEHATQEQKKWSKKYLKKAKEIVPWLRFFPGIRAAAVCNSVALGTAEKGSDIDLLIITASGKLWTARIFSTLFFQMIGMRRHRKKIAGRFCLSFFVTKEALCFEKIAIKPKDPYLAFWVSTLVPIFGKESFETILKKNSDFVMENGSISIVFQKTLEQTAAESSWIRNVLETIFGVWFERAMKKFSFLVHSKKGLH